MPSLRCWHHCRRHPGAAGASSPLRRWRPCGHCPGTVAIVAVATLASSQRWHHHRHCLASLRHCCHCGTGIIADIALALLPMLPLRCWRHHGCCDGAIANVVWAPSPLWRWRCHPCHAGVIAWVVLPLRRWRKSPLLGVGPLGASAAISSCHCPSHGICSTRRAMPCLIPPSTHLWCCIPTLGSLDAIIWQAISGSGCWAICGSGRWDRHARVRCRPLPTGLRTRIWCEGWQ
jgi:hypothetical protein